MRAFKNVSSAVLLMMSLLFLSSTNSLALPKAEQKRGHPSRMHPRAVSRAELRDADARLSEMGYGTGRNALIAFQKYEGRKVTGQLSREDFDAIMSATAPQAKDSG